MKTTPISLAWLAVIAFRCASARTPDAPSTATPRPRCEAPLALRITLPPSYCGANSNQYFWDGARCAQVNAELACTCGVTRDCGPSFATVDDCEATHAHCR